MKNKKILGVIFLILAVFSLGSCSLIDKLEGFIEEAEQELGITQTTTVAPTTSPTEQPTTPPATGTTVQPTVATTRNQHLRVTHENIVWYRPQDNLNILPDIEYFYQFVMYDDMTYEEALAEGIVIDCTEAYKNYIEVNQMFIDYTFIFSYICGNEKASLSVSTLIDYGDSE